MKELFEKFTLLCYNDVSAFMEANRKFIFAEREA